MLIRVVFDSTKITNFKAIHERLVETINNQNHEGNLESIENYAVRRGFYI